MDGHHQHHSKHQRDTEVDQIAAERAWELWKSSNPEDWDRAIDARATLSKHDSKAWAKGMHHVEEEESKKQVVPPVVVAEKTIVIAGADKTREETSQTAAGDRLREEYLAGQKIKEQETAAPLHAGYAPQSRFAPAPPDSPAYDSAYNRPQAEFHGLDLGIIKSV